MRSTGRGLCRWLPGLLFFLLSAEAPPLLAAECNPAVLCPGSGACTITGTHTLSADCALDFGTRNVTLKGTLKAEAVGDSFSVAAGSLTLMGGKLKTDGDAETTAGDITVTVADAFTMSGAGALVDAHANGGGGTVWVEAGTIDVQPPAAIDVNGGSGDSCGDGGTVTLTAIGRLAVAKVTARTPGYDCAGGTIELIGSPVEIGDDLDASGGDSPGGIYVTATSNDIEIDGAAALDASGRGNDGEGSGASGGSIELYAGLGNVTVAGSLSATGSGPDGSGGAVEINFFSPGVGAVSVVGQIDVRGEGSASSGGTVSIGSGTAITLTGDVIARGGQDGYGGDIDIEAGNGSRADGDVTVSSTLDVNGGMLGTVSIASTATGLISGTIEARGLAGGVGGSILIAACELEVTGDIDAGSTAAGSAGTIALRGGNSLHIAAGASLEAQPCSGGGCITLSTRSGSEIIDPGADIDPPPIIATDPTVNACCGNGRSNDAGEQCDDGNALSCDGCSLTCVNEPNPVCPDDGDACTQPPTCVPTQGCVYSPVQCDDGVVCTENECDPGIGCFFNPDDTRCQDDNPCTSEEVCNPAAGDPVSGCAYTELPDGEACADQSPCTVGNTCQDGVCGQQVCCDDGNPCTVDSCHSSFGCSNVESLELCPSCTDGSGGPLAAGTPCTDDDSFTVGDTCNGTGQCIPGPARDCEDGDSCTYDTDQGGYCLHYDYFLCYACSFSPDGAPCSDYDVCTTGVCMGGQCASAAIACDDGDPSDGTEICDSGIVGPGCVRFPPLECSLTCGDGILDAGEACDDGNNIGGDCCSPTCDFEPAGAPCLEDGEECTTDVCDGAGTCSNLPETGPPCDDGDACTSNDTCQGGICIGDPSCDDGNPCTTNDACAGGTCSGEATPRTDCRLATRPGSGFLLMQDEVNDARDRLLWKWLAGEATSLGDFAVQDYTLCLFDSSGTAQPAARLSAAASSCESGSCWISTPTCRLYRDASASQDGLKRIQLCAGASGDARIKLVAKGLPLPDLASLVPPVKAQLQGANGLCWQSAYLEDTNPRAEVFKAKAE